MTELKNCERPIQLYKDGFENFCDTQEKLHIVLRKIFAEFMNEVYPGELDEYNIEYCYSHIEINRDGVIFWDTDYYDTQYSIPTLYLFDREAWREQERLRKEKENDKYELMNKNNAKKEMAYLEARIKELSEKYPEIGNNK